MKRQVGVGLAGCNAAVGDAGPLDLTGMKNTFVLNNEAHHCRSQKPPDPEDEALKGDDRKEADKNNEVDESGPMLQTAHPRANVQDVQIKLARMEFEPLNLK